MRGGSTGSKRKEITRTNGTPFWRCSCSWNTSFIIKTMVDSTCPYTLNSVRKKGRGEQRERERKREKREKEKEVRTERGREVKRGTKEGRDGGRQRKKKKIEGG